ncbi:MAG TPA: exodeoxyribonuclease III [Stellaceae bacterium]|jgi:exodeoxyribonuclease-3|nr:exodeoxyribonuclease III [Stellaceae bacterium]
MKIATWNVNSAKVRLSHILDFLKEAQPDVLCLQEIKCPADDFPRLEINALGYQVEAIGQRAYNGVAILSRHPPQTITRGLPGDDSDQQARYIEASFGDGEGEVRIASAYMPNGNPVDTDKFSYKLAWMERLIIHVEEVLRREIPFVIAGDYNVCPTDDDVYDPVAWRNDALCRIESRACYRTLLNLGLTDAFRVFHREPHRYTFWDYQAGRWNRDEGLRIDHLLLSPHAADRVVACDIDKAPRGKERASDHTPIWCELAA